MGNEKVSVRGIAWLRHSAGHRKPCSWSSARRNHRLRRVKRRLRSSATVLSGQISWFAAGQETLFSIDSAYTGAVRITGQLAGSAAIAPIFIGSEVSGPDIVIPSASVSPYWRFWDGQMSFAQSGCYTLTFQRNGADDAVTLYVHSGSPPPG
jgi:hypothetical protein